MTDTAEENLGLMAEPGMNDGRAVVAAYLDNVIDYWRRQLLEMPPITSRLDVVEAMCYIDGYQSARSSLLGSPLPLTEEMEAWLEQAYA